MMRHVRYSLGLVAYGVFTQGTAEEFGALVEWVRQHPKRKGLAGLP